MASPKTPPEAIVLFGTEEPRPAVRVLRAGRLSVELEAGKLRYVSIDGLEAIRVIAFIVRGPGWETFHPTIANLEIEERDERFRVSYDGAIDAGCGSMRLRASIEGQADGALRFDMACEAISDFNTNRTGFVILHGIAGIAGQRCKVEHVDGGVEETEFPDLVMARQPFFEIRAMTHEIAPGLEITCRMEGEEPWECEDQRNWTDASYKTYYRPLRLPYPYLLEAGSIVQQTVTIAAQGGAVRRAMRSDGGIQVTLGGPVPGTMPKIGLGVPAHQAAASLAAADLVRDIGVHLLVCAFDPSQGHGELELDAYRRLSEATGVPVQLEIVVPCMRPVGEEIAEIAARVRAVGVKPEAVMVEQARLLKFTLDAIEALGIPSFEETYGAARAAFPGAALGGGVFSNFTELNRNHPDPELYDFITHSTCAVVHEADDRSVMKTLETLPSIIRSVRAFSGGKPYRIAPSAIGMRQNPYGPSTHDNQANARVSFSQQDPRHRALFGAAFTLGYLARMAAGGVDLVSVGAPVGEFGMAYRRMSHPQPWFDDLDRPAVFPLCHVVAALAHAAGAGRLKAESAAPETILALSHAHSDGRIVWLANLTAERQAVRLTNLPGREAVIGRLDAGNFVQAAIDRRAFAASKGETGDPSNLSVEPYGVVRIAFDG